MDRSFLLNALSKYSLDMGQSNFWSRPGKIPASPTQGSSKASIDKKKKRKAQRVARRLNR
jgi:hypothetical protein